MPWPDPSMRRHTPVGYEESGRRREARGGGSCSGLEGGGGSWSGVAAPREEAGQKGREAMCGRPPRATRVWVRWGMGIEGVVFGFYIRGRRGIKFSNSTGKLGTPSH